MVSSKETARKQDDPDRFQIRAYSGLPPVQTEQGCGFAGLETQRSESDVTVFLGGQLDEPNSCFGSVTLLAMRFLFS